MATQQEEYPFFPRMTEEQKQMAREEYRGLLAQSLSFVNNKNKGGKLLVLDEVLHALRYGMIEEEKVLQILDHSDLATEIVLTGYDPSERVLARADYITQMVKERHPFDQGITSRTGVEE